MSSPGYFYTPEDQANLQAIQRRQQYAQALMEQGEGDPGKAAYGGLRNAGNAILGAFLARKADKASTDLASQAQGKNTQALASLLMGNQQQPAQPQATMPPPQGAPMPAPSPQITTTPGQGPQTPGPQQLDPEGNPLLGPPSAGASAPPSPQPQQPGMGQGFAQRLAGTNNPYLMQTFAPALIKSQLDRENQTWENSQPLSVADQQRSQAQLQNQEALAGYNNKLPMTAAQTAADRRERSNAFETQRHNKQTEYAAMHPFGMAVGVGQDGTPLSGDAFLGELGKSNPGLSNQVKAIGTYRQPGVNRGTKEGFAMMSLVNQAFPGYDSTQFPVKEKARKDFGTGVQGKSVVAINNAMAHLDLLGQLGDALQNGDVQLFNKAKNAYEQATGQAAPTTFDAVRNIAAQEVVKSVVPGGGGVAERAAAAQDFQRSASSQQLHGAINGVKGLFAGQLSNYRQQYHKLTNLDDFDDFLSPETRALSHAPVAQTVGLPAPAQSGGKKTIKFGDLP